MTTPATRTETVSLAAQNLIEGILYRLAARDYAQFLAETLPVVVQELTKDMPDPYFRAISEAAATPPGINYNHGLSRPNLADSAQNSTAPTITEAPLGTVHNELIKASAKLGPLSKKLFLSLGLRNVVGMLWGRLDDENSPAADHALGLWEELAPERLNKRVAGFSQEKPGPTGVAISQPHPAGAVISPPRPGGSPDFGGTIEKIRETVSGLAPGARRSFLEETLTPWVRHLGQGATHSDEEYVQAALTAIDAIRTNNGNTPETHQTASEEDKRSLGSVNSRLRALTETLSPAQRVQFLQEVLPSVVAQLGNGLGGRDRKFALDTSRAIAPGALRNQPEDVAAPRPALPPQIFLGMGNSGISGWPRPSSTTQTAAPRHPGN